MIFEALKRVLAVIATIAACHAPASAEEARTYSFNVLNHRTTAITAGYWNPILSYVSQKSGVKLELKLSKSIEENTIRAESGAFDFLFTNHFFTPERDRLGYRVIARPAGPGIRGQVVVTEDSPIRTLNDLQGKTVAFSTPDGLAGFYLPMDALVKAGVRVKPVFSGSHHRSLNLAAQNVVAAAGVNDTVLEDLTQRTTVKYRVLWASKAYNDLCIMSHPRVPKEKVDAVKEAFVNMLKDPQGRKILEAGAELLHKDDELGFVAASNRDYDDYRAFFKQTRVKRPD
jgi:phosphonate transport system substrate-binding protein